MITPSTGVAAAAPVPMAAPTASTFGSDAFLKLLVAQLKYQDPTKPVDSAAFMAQTAQLQMVETLQSLVKQNADLLSGQNSLSALSLTGRTVSYTLDGISGTGAVTSVKLTPGGPTLLVNHAEVPLSAVTEVHP